MKKLLFGIGLMLWLPGPAWAEDHGKVEVEVLARATASWDGADLPDYGTGEVEVTILRIEIPPGTRLPLHKHPVINAGVLLKGKLTVVTESGKTLFRRRRYLVDKKRQLSSTLRVAGLVFLLLLTLNGLLAWQSYKASSAVMASDPVMGERMRAIDHRNMAITAGISLIILSMVVVRSVMMTHRTAGAVHKVSMCLEEITDFNFDVHLRLRKEDTIRALEEPFNKMAENLKRRAVDDYEAMQKLADEIEEHGNPVDAEMLRRIADSSARKPK